MWSWELMCSVSSCKLSQVGLAEQWIKFMLCWQAIIPLSFVKNNTWNSSKILLTWIFFFFPANLDKDSLHVCSVNGAFKLNHFHFHILKYNNIIYRYTCFLSMLDRKEGKLWRVRKGEKAYLCNKEKSYFNDI